MRIKHKDHNRPTLEVDHCFLQSQKFTLQDEVIYHQVIPIVLGIAATLFIIHQRHNFLPILALILLNSNTLPTDLFVFVNALLTVHYNKNPIFQHTYANFVMLENYTT